MATFWSRVCGGAIDEPGEDRPGWLRVAPRGPDGPFMNFQPVNERPAGKVRIHLDLLVDEIESAAERVLVLGGSDTGTREFLSRGCIAVMRDPEGNEFCLLAPPAQ